MKDTTYTTDIKAYIKYGNKQNSNGLLPTTHYEYVPAESQDLTTKISTRSAQFGRVAIVAGLTIVSAPIAIASSIVFAVPYSLFQGASFIKDDIHKYIKAPQEERSFIRLLKDTIENSMITLLAMPFLFSTFLTIDLSLLLVTYLTHTNHMQHWNIMCDHFS